MNPPPIGEALSVGWNTFKENMGPIAIGMLCEMLLSLVPLVGGGLAFAGFMQVSLKALRRQPIEPKDGFVGLEAPLDHIIMGLLQIAGVLACCVGVAGMLSGRSIDRPPGVLAPSDPVQNATREQPFAYGDYEITPLASYDIEARVRTAAQTGVEMEALTAVAVAALTIYDMVKAVDKSMVIGEIRLMKKTGGKSGEFRRDNV